MKESNESLINQDLDDSSDDRSLIEIDDSIIEEKKEKFLNQKDEYSTDLTENIKRYKRARKNFERFIKNNSYLKNANEYEVNLARLDILNTEIHLLLLARCAYIYHRNWLNLNWPTEKRESLSSEKSIKKIPGYLYLCTQAYLLQIYRDKLNIKQIKEDSFSQLINKITPSLNKILNVFLEKQLTKGTFFSLHDDNQDIQSFAKKFAKIIIKLISKFENIGTSQLISMSFQFLSLKKDFELIKKEIENEFGDLNELRKENSINKVELVIIQKTQLISEITYCLEQKASEYINEATDKFKHEISSEIESDFQSVFYQYFKDKEDKTNVPPEYTIKMDTKEILSSFGFDFNDNLLTLQENDQHVEKKMLSIEYNTNNNNNIDNNSKFPFFDQNTKQKKNIIGVNPLKGVNPKVVEISESNEINKNFEFVSFEELKSKRNSNNLSIKKVEQKVGNNTNTSQSHNEISSNRIVEIPNKQNKELEEKSNCILN